MDLLLAYRLPELHLGDGNQEGNAKQVWFDLYGGARYDYLKIGIDVDPGMSVEQSSDWVELAVGGRVKWFLRDDFALLLRGDVSGFGIGEASDLSWNIVGGADWRFSRIASLKFGYKIFGMDYSKGSGGDKMALNLLVHGPIFAISFYF